MFVAFLFMKILSDQEFMIVVHCNFSATMHGFRDIEVLMETGHDVIVSSPPGNAARTITTDSEKATMFS